MTDDELTDEQLDEALEAADASPITLEVAQEGGSPLKLQVDEERIGEVKGALTQLAMSAQGNRETVQKALEVILGVAKVIA